MPKKFAGNPRPMLFCLYIMFFLCLLLVVLYLLAEKENTLLKTARSEQFIALAAGEAEAAADAWRMDQPTAEVYHRLCSAAEYLAMAEPSETNRELIRELRNTGAVLLQNGMLPVSLEASLQTFAGDIAKMTADIPETEESPAPDAPGRSPYPWENQVRITRRQGDTMAETMTQTRNTLTPAAGKNFIYTCRNVYVKLSQKGGVPLEIAVYTPVCHDPSYSREECTFRSRRFLESVLPADLREKTPISVAEGESRLRFLYPCGSWQVRVDIRQDTGRIVGLQMLPETQKEQPLPTGKDCSATYAGIICQETVTWNALVSLPKNRM